MAREAETENEARRIQCTRTISAPAGQIFSYLARPDHHVHLDASGMVRSSADHLTVTGVGTVFVMNMHSEVGDYQVENHVVVYEPDHAIGWAPAGPGDAPAGHTFVWRLTPAGDTHTVVTQTYDWSAFTHLDVLEHLPVVSRDQLQTSLDRLAGALE